jgi:hypothetical protein
MASPLATGKQTVNLASKGVPGSRIRRDPPPVIKEIAIRDPEERDRRAVVIGVLAFAIALVVIMLGISSFAGWTPRDYTVSL